MLKSPSTKSPWAVISALSDSDCREILIATSDESVSVSELIDKCEIASATAYRKVERLVDLSLLDEQIRIRPKGRNCREYRLRVETIHIEMPDQPDPDMNVSCTITGDESIEDQ